MKGCFDQRKASPHSAACDEHGQASLHSSFNQNASADLTPSAALGLGLRGRGGGSSCEGTAAPQSQARAARRVGMDEGGFCSERGRGQFLESLLGH